MATVDTVAAKELYLFIENDGDLYRQQHLPIIKNLVLKIDRGVYDHEKAVKLYGFLAENGAKKYTKQFAGIGDKWNEIFNKPTREAVAREFVRYFETEYKLGAFNNLHAKKYSEKGGALKNPAVHNTNADIYDLMKRAGVQMDHHESDLYVPVNEITTRLIKSHKYASNVTTFTSQIDGKRWYDIPFAYKPFWKKKRRRNPGMSSVYHSAGGSVNRFKAQIRTKGGEIFADGGFKTKAAAKKWLNQYYSRGMLYGRSAFITDTKTDTIVLEKHFD